MILVQQGTLEASRQLDTLFDGPAVHHPDKADASADLLRRHTDLDALGQAIGIEG